MRPGNSEMRNATLKKRMILTEKELKYVIVYVYGPRHTCGGYINGERQEKVKEREREKSYVGSVMHVVKKKRYTIDTSNRTDISPMFIHRC